MGQYNHTQTLKTRLPHTTNHISIIPMTTGQEQRWEQIAPDVDDAAVDEED